MTHTSKADRLAALLAKERAQHKTYIGCMKKGPVVNDPNMKWSVNQFLFQEICITNKMVSSNSGTYVASKLISIRLFCIHSIVIISLLNTK
jgi:hypothetical protein